MKIIMQIEHFLEVKGLAEDAPNVWVGIKSKFEVKAAGAEDAKKFINDLEKKTAIQIAKAFLPDALAGCVTEARFINEVEFAEKYDSEIR